MNAVSTTSRLIDDTSSIRQMSGGALGLSLVLHVFIAILAIVGLPHFTKPPEIQNTTVPVEIVEIGEITTTNKPPVQAPKPKEPPPEEKPVQRKEAPPKPPAPPKVEPKQPPVAKPPEPPKEKPKAEPKPAPVVPPPDAQKLEKPAEKPPEPKPVEQPPQAQPQPEPPKPQPDDNQQAFDSLLRNLQDSEPQMPAEAPVTEELLEPPLPSPIGDFSKQLLVSEADALSQQLAQCWSIQAGARYAENLIVEVRLTVNRDRTVQNAVIQDRWRYNNDPAFRAAADSAIRAVLSPMCTPLRLPPEKYEGWKDIIVNFDPKDML